MRRTSHQDAEAAADFELHQIVPQDVESQEESFHTAIDHRSVFPSIGDASTINDDSPSAIDRMFSHNVLQRSQSDGYLDRLFTSQSLSEEIGIKSSLSDGDLCVDDDDFEGFDEDHELEVPELDDEISNYSVAQYYYDCGGNAQRVIQRLFKGAWTHTQFTSLPQWLKDNDFLHGFHRPQIESLKCEVSVIIFDYFYQFFSAVCLESIFRVHSETGNIWTHLIGSIAFLTIAIHTWCQPNDVVPLMEKIVFSAFYTGAILCMGFSFMFHTMYCHSENVGRWFSKLDYCGIACMVVGSFIPVLHYGFYCSVTVKIVYIALIAALSAAAIIISLLDFFGRPKYRSVRAALFIAVGLSGVVPIIHSCVVEGIFQSIQQAGYYWFVVMAVLYIGGALMYAMRVPERFFPGKFDIFLHSHQIFHLAVIAAAFVHYHGITQLAIWRQTTGSCNMKLNSIEFDGDLNKQEL